jgi:hypothetical protein
MSDDPASVLCPECGEDVCTTRDTARGWTHRSRVLPKALTGCIALLIVLTLAFTGSGWDSYTASSFQFEDVVKDFSEVLDPIISVGQPGYLDGEGSSSREAFIESLAQKLSEVEKQYWRVPLRLVSVEPNGMTARKRSYGVGEEIFRWKTDSHLLDVRTPDAWDRDPYQSDTVWVFYGPYEYSREVFKHNFALKKTFVVNYVSIFAVLASSWLLIWILGLMLARFGIQSLNSPKRLLFGLGILLLGIGVFSLAFPNTLSYTLVNDPPTKTSEWVAYNTLAEIVDQAKADPNRDSQLWAMIESISPDIQDGDLIVGIQYDYIVDSRVKLWSMGIGPDIELLSGSTRWILKMGEDENAEIVEFPSEIKRGLSLDFVDWRYFTFGWQSDRFERSVDLAPTSVMSVAAGVIWFWMLARWVALRLIKRAQRRRVRRDQCIFCAYPLSDEGKKARSLGIGSSTLLL